jgi:hypothetical protein
MRTVLSFRCTPQQPFFQISRHLSVWLLFAKSFCCCIVEKILSMYIHIVFPTIYHPYGPSFSTCNTTYSVIFICILQLQKTSVRHYDLRPTIKLFFSSLAQLMGEVIHQGASKDTKNKLERVKESVIYD